MADLSAFAAMAARAGVVPHLPQGGTGLGNRVGQEKSELKQKLSEAVPLVPRVPLKNEVCPTFSGEKSHVVDPSPIAPDHVRAGVARELRHLADLGVTGPEAERQAVAITAGKIRNSPALAERQAHGGRCHQCGEPLDDGRPVVAVLNPGGGHLWLHGDGCREAFGARRAALVDRIMAAAGYGAAAPHDGRDGA